MRFVKKTNRNLTLLKILNFIIVITIIIAIYFYIKNVNEANQTALDIKSKLELENTKKIYNVWLIFTKVTSKSPLRFKFRNLLNNLINISSVPLDFNLIVDNESRAIAVEELQNYSNKSVKYYFYDVDNCVKSMIDIVEVMKPHFSSKTGGLYSDSLFYISLGLYRIAPKDQKDVVLLDCDLYFKKDIALLFKEFDHFKSTALFGLAPELSTVYRTNLRLYAAKNKRTSFGEYHHDVRISNDTKHSKGFPGYNSGVVLMRLDAISKSKDYSKIIRNETVIKLCEKYQFRGHLGDQDFYTLIGFEYPQLVQTLSCGFNRQLCKWWKKYDYENIFDFYFKCNDSIVVLHGNCNTRIPKYQLKLSDY